MVMQQNSIKMTGMISTEDVPPSEVPPDFWTLAQDVHFREGIAQRVNGWDQFLGTASVTPIHVRNSFFNGTSVWYYLSAAAIYRVSSAGVHSNITGSFSFSGKVPNDITSCELNGLPVFNAGVDAPVYHDRSTSNVVDLPDWPTGYTCQVMRAFKNYLIAMDIDDGSSVIPSMVMWSDAADPGAVPDDGFNTTWTASGNNDAGNLSVGGATEGIVDGQQLRDVFMIAKPHSLWSLQFVGGTAIFGLRQLSQTVGALARNCIAEVRGSLIMLSDGDIVQTDGQQIRSLADSAVRRKIFASIDPEQFEQSFVLHHKLQKEVWICYPDNGASIATTAAVYNYERERWSFRDLSIGGTGCSHADAGNITQSSVSTAWSAATYSWDSASADVPWNSTRVETPNDGIVGVDYDTPSLVRLDEVEEPDDGSVRTRLVRESLDFGLPDTYKLVNEIRPRIIGSQGDIVNVRIGGQNNADDPIQWSAFQPYEIGTTETLHTVARGRFISAEFLGDNNRTFRMPGFDIRWREAGRYGG